MAIAGKVNGEMSGEVPFAVAAAAVALVALSFIPVVHRVQTYPSGLPPLRYDARAVEVHEAAESTRALPDAAESVLAAWEALARASATRRPQEMLEAQHAFAESLRGVTGGMRSRQLVLRALARRRFLRAVARSEGSAAEPLVLVARRHGLVGEHASARMSRAIRIAWFDFRWERFSLPTPEQGPLEPLADTLLRIPTAEAQTLVAWGLAARCADLLGVTDYPQVGDPERCAAFRRELIPLATGIDGDYPGDEAFAATDVLHGLGMRALADRALDESSRAQALAGRQAAMIRARDRYAALLGTQRSRRLERYLMAVTDALGREAL